MIFDKLVVGSFETNCYLAGDADTLECAIIDPGAEAEKIINRIKIGRLKPKAILLTHGHFDHFGAVSELKEKFGIPVLLDKDDLKAIDESINFALRFNINISKPYPDELIKSGDIIRIGKYSLEVLETPGHTPGSVCYLADYEIFSGDTLFKNGVGRTDLPGGNTGELKKSLQKIIRLDENLKIFPGHGEETTIGTEKKTNPFLK
ncbi:MAG: MBL fold metallo-hydrolase [bacterium]|nr:MBL fold metallo-hydrolase [bacterium]